ncbi:MAG: hypothetical protein JOZ52_08555 [Acidobacteria bacterium]|nr:hypothetical protein [Acidobacteriota bacterium]
MRIDAKVFGRKEPFGSDCAWEGGAVAEVTSSRISLCQLTSLHVPPDDLESPIGKMLKLGGLNLRVIDYSPATLGFGFSYTLLVMRANDPRAYLQVLYRRAAHHLVRAVHAFEAWARKIEGVPEGSEMPFTAWLYKKLK